MKTPQVRWPRRTGAIGILCAASLLAAPAVAQPAGSAPPAVPSPAPPASAAAPVPPASAAAPVPPGSANQRAVAAGYDGLQLFKAGDYARAYEQFAAAEALFHSPVFELYMARSRRNTGKLLEARKLYQRVGRGALPADAPLPWIQAQRDAKLELDELAAIVPRLRIEVASGASGGRYQLMLDGRALSAQQRRAIELDPGAHQVELRADGATVKRTVQLLKGEKRTLRLPWPGAGPVTGGPGEPQPGPLWPAALSLSLGGAGLLAGAVTGGMALTMASDVNAGCVGSQCLVEDEDKAAQARQLATASTATLIGGGVLSALGVVLLVVRPGGDDVQAAGDTHVAVAVSPSGGRLWISF